MDEEPQQESVQPWRNNSEKNSKKTPPSEDKKRRFMIKAKIKYPTRNMQLKATMLDDLLSKFASKKSDHHGDCCEARIKDRFDFVQKPQHKRVFVKDLRNAALMLKDENEKKVSELVNDIKSSKFKITEDAKANYNLTRGVSTMSCYDTKVTSTDKGGMDTLQAGGGADQVQNIDQTLASGENSLTLSNDTNIMTVNGMQQDLRIAYLNCDTSK